MGITNRSATVTTATTRTARIYDGGAPGLTIEHLRAFLVEADRLGLPSDARVRLDNNLQPGGPYHTIQIVASDGKSTTVPMEELGEVSDVER